MAGKKPKIEEPEKPKYVMPEVEVGDVVLWHDSGEAEPTAMALVQAVGTETLSLAVSGEGYQNFLVKSGVRHKDHPNKEIVRQTGEGVWTHRPGYLKLLERLAFLEAAIVKDLKGPPAAPAAGQ